MTVTTAPSRRPSLAARRAGYLVGAVATAVGLYLVNVWPGWDAVPFLTGDTAELVGWINLALVIGTVANLVYAAYDPPWLTALGGLVTTGVGIAVLVRTWQVFPFDFTGSFDWALVIRVLLAVALVGSLIAVIVQLVTLIRALAGHVPDGR